MAMKRASSSQLNTRSLQELRQPFPSFRRWQSKLGDILHLADAPVLHLSEFDAVDDLLSRRRINPRCAADDQLVAVD